MPGNKNASENVPFLPIIGASRLFSTNSIDNMLLFQNLEYAMLKRLKRESAMRSSVQMAKSISTPSCLPAKADKWPRFRMCSTTSETLFGTF